MRSALSILGVLILTLGWGSGAGAHDEPVVAEITVLPGQPSVTRETDVTVRLYGSLTQSPQLGANVRLVGDMTAHRMVPVKTVLSPLPEPGSYGGKIAFTMAGEWVVTLQLEHLKDSASVRFPLQVHKGGEDISPGEPLQLTFDVFQHPAELVFSPWLAIAVTVFLLAAFLVLAQVNKKQE